MSDYLRSIVSRRWKAAIQAEIDMDGNVVDIKEGKRGIR